MQLIIHGESIGGKLETYKLYDYQYNYKEMSRHLFVIWRNFYIMLKQDNANMKETLPSERGRQKPHVRCLWRPTTLPMLGDTIFDRGREKDMMICDL